VSIPFRYTDEEMRRQKAREAFKAASVGVGFAVCALAIFVATRGYDRTLSLLKSVIGIT
jgi:hypothetical protein